MPSRRPAAIILAALLALAAIVASGIATPDASPSAAVGSTTTDPPSTTTPEMAALASSKRMLYLEPPTTTTTAPPPTTTTTRAPRPAPAPASGDRFDALAQCESGGDPTTNTGNGYYGAFQFSKSTWDSMGTGIAYPHHASYEVQKDAAIRLQARSGWGQWPACSRKLGYL